MIQKFFSQLSTPLLFPELLGWTCMYFLYFLNALVYQFYFSYCTDVGLKNSNLSYYTPLRQSCVTVHFLSSGSFLFHLVFYLNFSIFLLTNRLNFFLILHFQSWSIYRFYYTIKTNPIQFYPFLFNQLRCAF